MVTALDAEVKNEIFDTIAIILVKSETLFDNICRRHNFNLHAAGNIKKNKLDFVYLHFVCRKFMFQNHATLFLHSDSDSPIVSNKSDLSTFDFLSCHGWLSSAR